jgi:hypothetical protein
MSTAPGDKPPSTGSKWEHKGMIALLGAMVSLIPPVTAGVQAYITKEKEIELQRQKEAQTLALGFLDRATDYSKNPPYRKHMLEFLLASTDEGSSFRRWAEKVLPDIDTEIRAYQEQERATAKEKEKLQKERAQQIQKIQQTAQEIRNIESGGGTSADSRQKVKSLVSTRRAAERNAAELANRLAFVQTNLVALEEKTRLDAPSNMPAAVKMSVPINVRLLQVQTHEDGSWLRTRWTFRVMVNGAEVIVVPSDLYSDNGDGATRVLYQVGKTAVLPDGEIEIRIVGERESGGPGATGSTRVSWERLGMGSVPVRVAVPGEERKGSFEFLVQVHRAPRSHEVASSAE